jgi:hypothetical protein
MVPEVPEKVDNPLDCFRSGRKTRSTGSRSIVFAPKLSERYRENPLIIYAAGKSRVGSGAGT